MDELTLVQRLAVWAIPVLFAITLHEVAHGWVANRLGDPTAKMMGRLTLNPIKHIDPVGTILVPGVLLVIGSVIFGWARPVPVTWQNLKHQRRDMALVSAAGPFANLLMAIFWAMVIRIGLLIGDGSDGIALFLIYTGMAGVFINTMLGLLNLLPLPPLDGGRVMTALLPGPLSWKFSRLEPYGMFILLGLLFTGILGKILWPVLMVILVLMASLAGLTEETMSYLLVTLLR